MAAVTIPNAGTYDLLVDVGFLVDGFTLDDPVKGLLNSPDYVLDGSTSFASVAEGTLSVSVRRGRNDPDDVFNAGTMTFVLNDTLADGVFNPFDNDPSNPYYDQAQSVPGLAPGRAVQLVRYDGSTPEPLFTGFIANYEYQFVLGGLDTVTVMCVDNMYRLTTATISAHNPTKQFTGARINAILDRAEVDYPTGAARDIATGTVELGGGGSYSIAEGTNVKAYFDQITNTAERGRIFIDREGVLVSQNRIGITIATPVVTFTDSGSGVPYNDLTIDFKADEFVNYVSVSPLAHSTQVAQDAASQATYWVKSLAITDSLLDSNADALDLANYLLVPEPTPRFTGCQAWFGSLTSGQQDDVAVLEIGDIITIEKDIIIGGTPTQRGESLSIEGIEHRIGFADGHTIRVYTAPTVLAFELILDDPVYGRLDENNVLG